MLDQLDHMQVSTLVPTASVLCSQQQKHITNLTPARPSSLVSSYAVGPIDSVQVSTLQASLSDGQNISLLVPAHLPLSVLAAPAFKEGCEWGYTESGSEEWTIPQMVNEIYQTLREELDDEVDLRFYAWAVGFLLGSLTSLAETDRILALVGMAHLCFLLSFIPLDSTLSWPPYGLLRARFLHNHALKAYRAHVRTCREQGMSFSEAQRLALAAPAQ